MTDQHVISVGPLDEPDRYQLLALLGAGGEGEVWLADDTTHPGQRLAVKISSVHRADEDTWQQWAAAVTRFSHPGLVTVHAAFTGADRHRAGHSGGELTHRYVVMDYVDGVTLADWVTDHPDATLNQRRALLRELGAALDALHAGTVGGQPAAHGDVKPQNVIVTAAGQPVLLDLGLSRFTASTGFAGRSNAYAAPEQRGDTPQATAAADAYAFALTAAAVYTGTPPPVGDDGYLNVERLRSRLRRQPRTRRRPLVTRSVLTALASTPERRPRQLAAWVDQPRRRAGALMLTAAVLLCGGGTAAALEAGPTHHGHRAIVPPPVSFAIDATSAVLSSSAGHASAAHTHSAPKAPFVSALHLAMDWPGVDGCGNDLTVAAPASLPLAKAFGSDNFIRVVTDAGGGAWSRAKMTVTLSANSGATVHVLRVSVNRRPVAPPSWIFREVPPPHTQSFACGVSSISNTVYGYFNADLDAATVQPQDAVLPTTLGAGAGDFAFFVGYIDLSACAGNYSATVTVSYTQGNDPAVHTVTTGRVVLYGYGQNSTYELGYPDRNGAPTIVTKAVRTGSQGRCPANPGGAVMAPVNLPPDYTTVPWPPTSASHSPTPPPASSVPAAPSTSATPSATTSSSTPIDTPTGTATSS